MHDPFRRSTHTVPSGSLMPLLKSMVAADFSPTKTVLSLCRRPYSGEAETVTAMLMSRDTNCEEKRQVTVLYCTVYVAWLQGIY